MRVAPMGVNDILMAIQYKHIPDRRLNIPIIAFDGLSDATIDAGNLSLWKQYTTSMFVNVPVDGDHYFVSTHFRQASSLSIQRRSSTPMQPPPDLLGHNACLQDNPTMLEHSYLP